MRILRYFARAYPGRSLAVFACLLLAAATEGVGLSTLLPLLSVATGEAASAASGYEERVVAWLARVGLEPRVGPLLGLVVAALWTKAFLVLLAKRQVGYTVARIATDLRLGLLRALMAARWSYATRQPVGRTANAMATEADRASRTFEYLALIASYAVEATVYVGIACLVSWRGTLAALAAAALALFLLAELVRMGARAGRRQTELLGSLLGRLTDTLGVVKLLKATGREPLLGPLLEGDTRRLNRQLQRRVLAREALRALQEPVLGSLLALGLFGALVGLAMPLSSVLVLGLVFTRALVKVSSLQSKYQGMVTEASALWSIDSLIRSAEQAREPTGGTRAPHLERSIVFDDVRLRYEERKVLDGLSLEVPAGRITAVIGVSGSGKTTLTDLVTGLVLPESGRVCIDGTPLGELDLAAWRHQVGYVPQELLLLHDSVRRNVTLGDPEVDDADVEAALRDADAWGFVQQLDGGLDASVGERGTLLSGGQRQRIAIARALVHRPRLLILDEATAALDAESEAEVWRTVAALRGRTTVIAISHQPALAGVADRIYRIEAGRAQLVSARDGAAPAAGTAVQRA